MEVEKDCLVVSDEILSTYQKEARSSYFSNIITTYCHNPRVLFKIIESIIKTCPRQQTFSKQNKLN